MTLHRRTIGFLLLTGYVCAIVAANWAIARFGIVSVGFGLMAPAGVFFAGLCFEFRDLVQDTLGRWWAVVAILIGAFISAFISRQFALASGVAFLLGELADFTIYTPMRQRFWLIAMIVANTIGDIVDSAIFLYLAFGSLNFITGQVIGKAYCTLIPVALLWLVRRFLQTRRVSVALT
ncbi:MAG: VUT family protein [Chloroflexota bacterium]|nr:VUT family protein [Chloroflexota bacterium]